jgi:radical SAM superfamily enzyme YgiQ (UPF0313 family)
MRVLLVYTNQCRDLGPASPVGLSYVASATRSAGHEVKLLDLAFAHDVTGDLIAAIADFKPEVVGLSIRNMDNVIRQRFDSPLAALQQQVVVIRENARDGGGNPVPMVLGGPAVSILAEKTLELFDADYAIVGEGEKAFPDLLAAIEGGLPLSGVPGLCYRQDGKTKRNRSELLPHFTCSDMQQWVSWASYGRGGGTWPVQTKRGCPMRCIYCAYPLVEGVSLRKREPGEVVDEIEKVLCDSGPRTFEFVDSTFNVPSSHAIAICEEIIRRKIKAHFTAMGVTPYDVPDGLFPLMKRAGFNSVMITAEAGCDAMLDRLGKGFSMHEVENCLARITSAKLKSMWFFMLGGPGETMETCEKTISFAEIRLMGRKFLTIIFTGVRLLPGTALARWAIEQEQIAPGTDFSRELFYLSPHINEQEVISRINRAIKRNPSIVHAAEGGSPRPQLVLNRALNTLGVAPPYWRFLPELLCFPPVHYLRSRHPSVVAVNG